MSLPIPSFSDIFWLASLPFKSSVTLTDDFKIAALNGKSERMLIAATLLHITEQSEWGYALTNAARGGHAETLGKIIEQPGFANGNARQSWLDTALEAAAAENKVHAVLFLHEKGADPLAMGAQALRHVLNHGQAAVAEKLVPVDAVLTERTGEMLQQAVFSGEPACVRFVLNHVKNINPPTVIGQVIQYAKDAQLEDISALLSTKFRRKADIGPKV